MQKRGKKRKHGLPSILRNEWRKEYLAIHLPLYQKIIAFFTQKRSEELKRLNSLLVKNYIQPQIVQLTTEMFIIDVELPIQYLLKHLTNYLFCKTQLRLYDAITGICVQVGAKGDLRTFGARTFQDAYYACLFASAVIKPIYNNWLKKNKKVEKLKFETSEIQITGMYAVIDTLYPIRLTQLYQDLLEEEKGGKCFIRHHHFDEFSYDLETRQKQFTYKYFLESRQLQEQSEQEAKETKTKKNTRKLRTTITCHLSSKGKICILGVKKPEEINEAWTFFSVLLSKYQVNVNMDSPEFPRTTSVPSLTPTSVTEVPFDKGPHREDKEAQKQMKELEAILGVPDIPLLNGDQSLSTPFAAEEGTEYLDCALCFERHRDGDCGFLNADGEGEIQIEIVSSEEGERLEEGDTSENFDPLDFMNS